MRYLVVVPPERAADEAAFYDVECEEVAAGELLEVDDFVLHVHSVVDVPAGTDYDATLVCVPEPTERRRADGEESPGASPV